MIVQKSNSKINNYKHGSLARSVIGQQQVQGIDYAYTLECWLKGVNSISLNPVYDMGGDGQVPPSGSGGGVAQDAYGFNLNYFTGEYAAINSGVLPFPGHSGYMSSTDYKPLYNGNISSMAVNIGQLNQPLLYNYQYDQLNRIVSLDAFNGLNQTGNNWTALNKINDYQERLSYDANGNIQTYSRNGTTTGGTPPTMDNLTYNYNKDANGQLTSNKLTSVNDAVAAGNYPDDIDNQSANNYSYDAVGNLTQDVAGGINTITWTVYGKISSIAKADGSTIAYTYDAAGNRISKTVTPASRAATTTWYVRDATGNVMAVYTVTGSSVLTQSEQHLYGSSRLGIYNRNINADASMPTGTNANLIGKYFTSNFSRGNKLFELSNHLGNVLVTVSDKKIGVDANSDGVIDYYTADVITANDYYPFGSLMPGRTYSVANTNYRYGFNGKENDNEVKGEGNEIDYGMRIYDPRIGKFLSADPLGRKYPELTPYQFASNTPIKAVDIDGLEAGIISYGYRVTAVLVTGSVSVGATIDWQGNFKLYTSWSAGLGGGAYAGGGVSLSIYPAATSDEIMGGAINFGGSAGIPGLSASLDLNLNPTQNEITNQYDNFRLGASGGIKPGSLGPGGAEVHIDYSKSTPFFSANLFDLGITRNSLIASIKDQVDDSWFLNLSESQISNLVGYIYSAQHALKRIKDDNNAPASSQLVKSEEIPQKTIVNKPIINRTTKQKETKVDKKKENSSRSKNKK